MYEAERFLERYIKEPVKTPSKEEAIEHLKRIGLLDENGEVTDAYKPIIRDIGGEDVYDQGSTL